MRISSLRSPEVYPKAKTQVQRASLGCERKTSGVEVRPREKATDKDDFELAAVRVNGG